MQNKEVTYGQFDQIFETLNTIDTNPADRLSYVVSVLKNEYIPIMDKYMQQLSLINIENCLVNKDTGEISKTAEGKCIFDKAGQIQCNNSVMALRAEKITIPIHITSSPREQSLSVMNRLILNGILFDIKEEDFPVNVD